MSASAKLLVEALRGKYGGTTPMGRLEIAMALLDRAPEDAPPKPPPPPKPTLGRVLQYRLRDGEVTASKVGAWRPAVVVEDWGGQHDDGVVNLLVFLDGDNDKALRSSHTLWRTSVKEGAEPGNWRWPPRAP